ncbi:hypothetical protein DDT46_22520 [Mycobacteroides abscessus]|uniref:Uncharacterized protein n=1 Tax=Mycobacteroides abscessus TaxID=36809 RepID=A0ABD7HHD9_9MYCO|nr:hypothetical protein [Mycobacteroides abscessus]AWG66288.1 hypothetical protein DDT46_22520 [Mycobacteroides abscessus]RIT29520.1 hypothetical protein D2E76_25065 [Mycobacteroides abscessus]
MNLGVLFRTLDSLAKLCGFDLLARVMVTPPISNVDFANEAARLIESIASMVGDTDDPLRSLPIGASDALSDRRVDLMAFAGDDQEPWLDIGD